MRRVSAVSRAGGGGKGENGDAPGDAGSIEKNAGVGISDFRNSMGTEPSGGRAAKEHRCGGNNVVAIKSDWCGRVKKGSSSAALKLHELDAFLALQLPLLRPTRIRRPSEIAFLPLGHNTAKLSGSTTTEDVHQSTTKAHSRRTAESNSKLVNAVADYRMSTDKQDESIVRQVSHVEPFAA